MSAAEERLANDPTSELWGEHRSRYRFAQRFIKAGQVVLDVACGSGFGLEMLEAAGARAIGADYAADALHEIRARTATRRLLGADYAADALHEIRARTVTRRLLGADYAADALHEIRARTATRRLVRADALRLPFGTATVDAVVSCETLEHISDARGLVAELRRVLKPDGVLVLSTPNRDFRQSANPFHIREFTADELCDLLRQHFSEVRLYGQRPSPQYRYVPFLMLDPDWRPQTVVWKILARLPFKAKNALAMALGGRPFYPGEDDYCFEPDNTDGSHALVAVAR